MGKRGLSRWRRWVANMLLRVIGWEMVLLWKTLNLGEVEAEQALVEAAQTYMRHKNRERIIPINGTNPPTRH